MGATQTQIRRDGATALDSATPALAELAYDTTNKRLRVGDGSTVGATILPNRKDIQDSSFNSATTTNSGNTYSATITGVASYAAFQAFKIKINATNTGAATLNINSLGAKNIYKNNGGTIGAVASGDLLANYIYDMVYDGTQFLVLGGTASGSGGVVIVRNVYTSGATWTKPSGLLYVEVEGLGGGGGGGNVTTTGRAGGGGGAGGYARKLIAAASLGATETVTIGAGGASASAGGTTSFGAHITCNGGSAGQANTATLATGGAGGSASGGDVNITGQSGFVGTNASSIIVGGMGASSQLGAGGAQRITEAAGNAASGYGAGGGGTFTNAANSNAGGAGSAGIIIVTEYKSA